jgi:SAM-dependent methyltransferase
MTHGADFVPVTPRRYGIGQPMEGSSGRHVAGNGWIARSLRRWVRLRYLHYIEKSVPLGARLLEFGCGGGDLWLARAFRTTGLELAESSAAAARRVYEKVVVGDVQAIPAPSRSFDAAASIFVLEHLPPEAASRALGDLYRVLVPGGRLICVCDLECDHPLLRWARRHHPTAYREAYIDAPGHLGLRREDEWRQLVVAAGFAVVEWDLQGRFPLLDPCPCVQLSASARFPGPVRLLGRFSHWLSCLPGVASVWALGVTLADTALRRVLPAGWAYRLLFVVAKE